ncbi:MAG: hypothetical protein QXV09_00415 [Candidatus Bathyarchaeia archaeon]
MENHSEATSAPNGPSEREDYRIIYVIDEKEKAILLYDVRHRKKAYK